MPATADALNAVILSFPSLIHLARDGGRTRSWIQLARTGSFISNRYGQFSITKEDLLQMYRNFTEITPKAPTELPIDYDHLSMDPKKPGDGIAAGWMKRLELREDGDELWAEVEWTPDGAERIRNQEYRFISPSFVKNHTHKDGSKIGTTLLAAAVTNHPFLEGMKALTLYNCGAMGDLALAEDVINLPFADYESFEDCVAKNGDKDDPKAFCGWLKHRVEGRRDAVDLTALTAEWAARRRQVVSLAETGQRVMIAPGHARTQDEIGATFEVAEVVGDGDDAFTVLKDAQGLLHKWFRVTELLPASSTPANPQHPPLQPGVAPVVPAQMPSAAVPSQQSVPTMTPMMPGAPLPGAPMPNGLPAMAAAPAPTAAAPEKAEGPDADERKANEGAIGGLGSEDHPPPFEQKATDKDKDKDKDADQQAGSADADEVAQAIRKAVAAALAVSQPQQKGLTHMMFKLRNDKNEEITVTADQLAAAGVKIVPEGSTAIPTSELTAMREQVTSLSARLDHSERERVHAEMVAELDRLSKGAYINKVERDWAEKMWKDAKDLAGFKEWAATKTTPLVALHKEHGSGIEEPKDKGIEAQEKILALANTLAKDRGISLSEATKLAGAQLQAEAEAYREAYAEAS